MAKLTKEQIAGVKGIIRAYRERGLDPRTGIAVAIRESGLRPGAIGDGGRAIGLMQLNNAGGVLTGKSQAEFQSYADPYKNAAFAARALSKLGAKGKSLRDQVTIQTRDFERPADISGAIRTDLGNIGQAKAIYQQVLKGGGLQAMTPEGQPRQSTGASDFSSSSPAQRLQLIQSLGQASKSDPMAFIQSIQQARQEGAQAEDGPVAATPPGMQPTGDPHAHSDLGFDGSYKWAKELAKRFNVTMSSTYRSPEKNRAVGGSPTSAHMHKGKATDFVGNPQNLTRLHRWALKSGKIRESFWDPAGRYKDDGVIRKGRIGGHGDHAHLEIR